MYEGATQKKVVVCSLLFQAIQAMFDLWKAPMSSNVEVFV